MFFRYRKSPERHRDSFLNLDHALGDATWDKGTRRLTSPIDSHLLYIFINFVAVHCI
jgi:hypothetical protein